MSTVTLPALTFTPDAITAVQSWLTQQTTSAPTRLTVSIDNNPTTVNITVGDATLIIPPIGILIDSEAFVVTSKIGNVLTVTRSTLGTSSVIHSIGALVNLLQYPTINGFLRGLIQQQVQQIMLQSNVPTVTTQTSQINMIQSTLNAALSTAVT